MTLKQPTQSESKQSKRQQLSVWLVLFAAIGLVVSSCGSDSESNEAFVDTYDSYFQSFASDYNPASDIEDLGARSTVAVEATLVDVEDGRFFGASETEVEGVTLNLVFETDKEARYYVQLSRPMDSRVDQLKSVLPIGSRSVVYLQPNNDPLEGVWFNVRDDGNEWYFTTPQGWILDHPERGIVFPLEDNERQSPFASTSLESAVELADWLSIEKQG